MFRQTSGSMFSGEAGVRRLTESATDVPPGFLAAQIRCVHLSTLSLERGSGRYSSPSRWRHSCLAVQIQRSHAAPACQRADASSSAAAAAIILVSGSYHLIVRNTPPHWTAAHAANRRLLCLSKKGAMPLRHAGDRLSVETGRSTGHFWLFCRRSGFLLFIDFAGGS